MKDNYKFPCWDEMGTPPASLIKPDLREKLLKAFNSTSVSDAHIKQPTIYGKNENKVPRKPRKRSLH